VGTYAGGSLALIDDQTGEVMITTSTLEAAA
jgi:hypothetical protein